MLTGPLKPKECADIAAEIDGVYTIYPERDDRPVLVYCIMNSLPKWTVSRLVVYIVLTNLANFFI